MSTSANRIYVGDTNAGMFYVKYTTRDKKMEIVADSTASRYITTAIEIDHDTVAAGMQAPPSFLYVCGLHVMQQCGVM